MPVRFAYTKVVGQEQFVVDIAQWNPVTGTQEHDNVDEMVGLLDACTKMIDIKAIEMQERVLEVEGMRQFCTAQEWMKIRSVLDIVAGRNTAHNVVRQWQAEKEENEALEQDRIAHAMMECELKQRSYLDEYK